MRRQVMAAYKGLDYQNEIAPVLAEYNTRSRLAKLGYQFDGNNVCAFKADLFALISVEIDKLEADERKTRANGRKHSKP